MLSVHDLILIIFLIALYCTKANHIYHRHAYAKNTVRKDVECRQSIVCYVIGGTFIYLVVSDRNR